MTTPSKKPEKPPREVLNREWDKLVDDLFALDEPAPEPPDDGEHPPAPSK